MRDEEKMFNLLVDIRKMVVSRHTMHQETAKKYSGPSNKRTNGIRARECANILEEMNKLLEKYSESN